MEVEFSSTFLIAAVVWLVLWPASVKNGDDGLLGFVSLVEHGLNIVLMGGDFALNGLHMNVWHFRYVVQWGSAYVVVHSIMMLVELAMDKPHKPSYGFLSSESWGMMLWVVGLILVMTIFYFLTFALNKLKAKREDMDMQGDEKNAAIQPTAQV